MDGEAREGAWRCKQAQEGAGLRALRRRRSGPTRRSGWPLEAEKGARAWIPFLGRPEGKAALADPQGNALVFPEATETVATSEQQTETNQESAPGTLVGRGAD